MRDHSKHIELTREDAVDALLAKLADSGFGEYRFSAIEQIAATDAFGHVLAEDICAKTDIPNMLTCAMDSVALHWCDFADLPEGEVPDTSSWVRGVDWEFANTGVAMPAGFDTAVVIEHAVVSDDEQRIVLDAAPSKMGAGTRAVGSMMKMGDVVIEKGTLITPDVAARIAAAGHMSVLVCRKPRVAFIPTGNELVPANLPYAPSAPEKYAGMGHVFESNSSVVQGKTEKWNAEYVPFDIVSDEYEDIKAALGRAMDVADIIILNAGSSKGSDDWSVEVLDEMGEIICHQTSHGPGHHSSLTILRDEERIVPVLGISGPAGGASFTLDFYLRPAINAYLGLDPLPRRIPCKLAGSFGENKHARKAKSATKGEARPSVVKSGAKFYGVKFMELYPDETGQLWAKPVEGKAGSPETQHANAIYMLAAGTDDKYPEVGDVIEVEMR